MVVLAACGGHSSDGVSPTILTGMNAQSNNVWRPMGGTLRQNSCKATWIFASSSVTLAPWPVGIRCLPGAVRPSMYFNPIHQFAHVGQRHVDVLTEA